MKNLNELAQKIHESNKLRGFDVSKDNIGQTLMLIVGEIGEAMDAHQCGRFVPENSVECCLTTESIQILKDVFERHIKNTFEDELADIAIRTLDFCAAFGVEDIYSEHCVVPINVGEAFLNATWYLTFQYNYINTLKEKKQCTLLKIIHIIEVISMRHGINLEKHIALKMRYNETRPYKHGKLY